MPGENEFKAVRERKTWFEARERCLQDGGDLFYHYPDEEISEMVESTIEDAWFNHGDVVHVGLVHRVWKRTGKRMRSVQVTLVLSTEIN